MHRIEFLNFIISFGILFEGVEQFWNQLFIHEIRLLKEKPESFGISMQENILNLNLFKKYLKDFYTVLDQREKYPNNIVFCGVDVRLLIINLI